MLQPRHYPNRSVMPAASAAARSPPSPVVVLSVPTALKWTSYYGNPLVVVMMCFDHPNGRWPHRAVWDTLQRRHSCCSNRATGFAYTTYASQVASPASRAACRASLTAVTIGLLPSSWS